MLRVFLFLFVFSFNVQANDGYSAIESGGIVFKKTDNISMEKEELYVSKDKVRVKYHFKNVSDKDVETTVAFPLPGKTCGWFANKRFIEDFTAKVNGVDIKLNKVIEAVENKKSPEVIPFGMGKNITKQIKKLGLSLDCTETYKNKELMKIAQANGFAEDYKGTEPEYVQYQTEVIYHWKQVFKAGEIVEIEHEYTPLAGLDLVIAP